jgi:RNA polymerase sigma-70 factor (ECF subfamily)
MIAVTEIKEGSMQGETEALARALRSRDPEVIDLLIERYQYRLYRYLLLLTGNRQVAEDIFQETWIRVLERGYQYDGGSTFEPWLFVIARNLVIDRLRRTKPIMSLDGLMDPGEAGGRREIPAVRADSPVEHAEKQEEREQIAAALDRLPAAHREVLLLRFHEDLALEEIATVVSAPLSTVKSRLYRGLEMLRKLLEGGTL